MFGFLYAIILSIAGIKDSVDNEYHKSVSRMNAAQKGYDIYYDMHGREYYKDRRVYEFSSYRMPNGEDHRVIVDLKTKAILKDYTQELIDEFFKTRNEIIEEAEKHGNLYYVIQPPTQLMRNKSVFEKRIKGYCGRFETETGRRYGLSSLDNYYKFYYKKSGCEGDELFYMRDRGFKISKEEYYKWGGSDLVEDYAWVRKGGIV